MEISKAPSAGGDESTEPGAPGAPGTSAEVVSHFTDVLVALVPAEVLALHALALSIGTRVTGSGDSAHTVIDHPGEMKVVFLLLVGVAVVLYFAGAKAFSLAHLGRALIGAAAFVLWSVLQPSSAVDAFGLSWSPLLRTILPLVGAAVLGWLVTLLAREAEAG